MKMRPPVRDARNSRPKKIEGLGARCLVIIGPSVSADDAKRTLGELCDPDRCISKIAVFGSAVYRSLGGCGMSVELCDRYLKDNDCLEIDDRAFSFAKEWYKFSQDGGRITEYEGVELGFLAEYEIAGSLITMLKDVRIVRNVLSRESPTSILFLDRDGPLKDIVGHLCRAAGLPLVDISGSRGGERARSFILEETWCRLLQTGMAALLESLVRITGSLGGRAVWIVDSSCMRRFFLAHIAGARILEILAPPPAFRLAFEKGAGAIALLVQLVLVSVNPLIGLRCRQFFKVVWGKLEDNEGFKARFDFYGITVWDTMRPYMEDLFKERFHRIFRQVVICERIYRSLPADVALLSNDAILEKRIEMVAARRSGIPSLVFQHGVLGSDQRHHILAADKVAVWGDLCKEWYLEKGNDAGRIAVTGSPKYDWVSSYVDHPPSAWNDEIYETLKIDRGLKIFLYPTDFMSHASSNELYGGLEIMCKSVVRAMRSFPDAVLAIKLHPHPSEDLSTYRRWIAEEGVRNVVVVKEIDIYKVVASAELLVTCPSTVAVEALFWKKPLVFLHYGFRGVRLRSQMFEDSVTDAKIGVSVYRETELGEAIARVRNDKGLVEAMRIRQADFLRRYMGEMDGKSSERLLAVIEQMARERARYHSQGDGDE